MDGGAATDIYELLSLESMGKELSYNIDVQTCMASVNGALKVDLQFRHFIKACEQAGYLS